MRSDGFIECRHPDLPADQTAFFKVPRNGWEPIDEEPPQTSSPETPAKTDSPAAGESKNEDSERNLS